MVRLKDPLSDTNPLIQKQKSKTQSLIKKTKPLIHKKEKKKEEKKKDKPKNPNRISQSRFRLIISCDSPLQIHIHTNQTSVFQPIKQTNKKKAFATVTTSVRRLPPSDRKSTRLNSSHLRESRMPSSA